MWEVGVALGGGGGVWCSGGGGVGVWGVSGMVRVGGGGIVGCELYCASGGMRDCEVRVVLLEWGYGGWW